MPKLSTRRQYCLWTAWFSLVNVGLYTLLGIPYLQSALKAHQLFVNTPGLILIWIFTLASFIAQLALISFAVWLVAVVPFILLFAKRWLTALMAVLSSTIAAIYFLVDGRLYTLYRFHLSPVFIKMAMADKWNVVFGFSPREWLFAGLIVVIIFCVEALLLWWVWNWRIKTPRLKHGRAIGLTLVGCLVFSYITVILSVGIGESTNVFIQQTQSIPLYQRTFTMLVPIPHRLTAFEVIGQRYFAQPKQATAPLNYPIKPLQCEPPEKYNMIFVVIDTWRFRTINNRVMPNLARFTRKNIQFTNHWSGGNGTQAGLFSLFYAMPSTYWTSVEQQKVSPVFFQQLRKLGYELNYFSSSPLNVPDMKKTALLNIENAVPNNPYINPGRRDTYTLKAFVKFLNTRTTSSKPFFSFVFLDAAHSYCRIQHFKKRFKPAIESCNRIILRESTNAKLYKNRYFNALHFDDQLIGKLLQSLKQNQLLKNTIIVFTGDHGSEFNDNGLNYWDHASNFTRYQVGTPLVLHWPRQPNERLTHWTSHYDIIPTLMQDALHCQNHIQDYSIGYNLFDRMTRPYLLIGSYVNAAIVTPKRITILNPNGRVRVEDHRARPLKVQPDLALLRQVLQDMRRFY
jgi:uncharacterized protein